MSVVIYKISNKISLVINNRSSCRRTILCWFSSRHVWICSTRSFHKVSQKTSIPSPSYEWHTSCFYVNNAIIIHSQSDSSFIGFSKVIWSIFVYGYILGFSKSKCPSFNNHTKVRSISCCVWSLGCPYVNAVDSSNI
jgi:hypothetical protein